MGHTEYWPTTDQAPKCGAQLELRSHLAWLLLERFALVAAPRVAEDSSGRAALDMLPAGDAVDRAFEIADLFVAAAVRRGGLRPFSDDDLRRTFTFSGELVRIRSSSEFAKGPLREAIERAAAELSELP